MSKLGWNEIRQRAIQFARAWEEASSEKAEAQTFWNEFFDVFGVKRKTVAAFEMPVKTLKNTYGFIDLFWKGKLLAEHKSGGKALVKAESQAFQYIQDLVSHGREDEVPRYVILSNFQEIVLHDLDPDAPPENGESTERFAFPLADFHKHVKHFAFIIGQKTHRFGEEDPANLQAAQIMADLHDAVAEGNYTPEALERLMVRLLFCLFGDDTGIFEPGQFELYIDNKTKEDGSDLGNQLSALFDTLNTPQEKRSTLLDEDLAAFPYINGELFAERLPLAGFNRAMRDRLRAACRFDWSRISPALFGSLFQGIMDKKERRQIGAHYTSERDILKVIRPLFLDELRAEFGRICEFKNAAQRKSRLEAFQAKLRAINVLDPACGCGNFLVIAYRELRRLELDALKLIHQGVAEDELAGLGEAAKLSKVDVDQFYGIEIGEWPARIAETALWLTDHQMNTELSLAFGNLFQRIPLRAAPHIRCANALRMDWNDLLPAEKCAYVLGNPPFIGHHFQSSEQKSDQKTVLNEIQGNGVLDYVCNWYVSTAKYIQSSRIRCALVSTNSISQGEQAGILWSTLFQNYKLKIHFAHRTFSWMSEARGAAHVHVVIIGFAAFDTESKRLFDYHDSSSEPQEYLVANISPYLVEGPDLAIVPRNAPVCDVPRMLWGNKPTDGGNFILTPEERDLFIKSEPESAKYIRPYMGGGDFINGIERYCLWLVNAAPKDLKSLSMVSSRIAAVREFRLKSKAESTRKFAAFPTLFRQIAQPDSDYLAIPEVSSERRSYIPMAKVPSDVICSNTVQFVSSATLYHFGILTSFMHMAWVRQVCGRLKSDYRYSNSLVYNNFPWPIDATDVQKAKVEACAQTVLDARQGELDKGQTLADLYDPLYMPGALLKAHQALDRAVDRCYRPAPFASERERVEYLFALYEHLTAPLAPSPTTKKRAPRRKGS